MLNQKTLRKQKTKKKTFWETLAWTPKIRRIRKPKNLGETKKTKKNNSGEVLRKRGSSQESLRIVFLWFVCFFYVPKFFFVFCFFWFWGVQPRVSQNCVFSLFVFPWFLVLFVFFLCVFLSFMHIYQCFLVLIVALMHLPNIYENLWKTKTQAPWPPLLYIYIYIYKYYT